MQHPQTGRPLFTRRTALISAAGGSLGVAALAACGDSVQSGTGDAGYGAPAPTKADSSVPTSESSPNDEGSSAGDAESPSSGPGKNQRELVPLAEVPVGGAVSATNQAGEAVIVTQPREGQVRAFSAICTHRGCTVAPAERTLRCPCHDSTFDPATGRRTGGPATEPLAEIAVRVDGASVVES